MSGTPRAEHHEGTTHPPTLLLLGLLLQTGLAQIPASIPASIPGLGWPVRVGGGVLILAGVALNLASTRAFARRGTPVRPLSPPVGLVTDGAFRLTRNPMYLGLVFVLLGNALALSSPWALLPVPPFAILLHRLILHEEALLERTFGDAFAGYRERVRRWL